MVKGATQCNKCLVGRDLLLEVIPKLINNEIVPIKQDESLVTYSYNILPEEERIDFNKNAREVFNLIRGLCPIPCRNTFLPKSFQICKLFFSFVTSFVDKT